jgi:hypothetical protein
MTSTLSWNPVFIIVNRTQPSKVIVRRQSRKGFHIRLLLPHYFTNSLCQKARTLTKTIYQLSEIQSRNYQESITPPTNGKDIDMASQGKLYYQIQSL